MSTPFQNRLVGTVIVAAVLIIFLPDILDGNKAEYQADFDPIPTSPQALDINHDKSFPSEKVKTLYVEETVEEVAIDEEQPNLNIQSQPLLKEKSITSTQQTNNVNKDYTIKLPEKALPKTAWVVQLGSFRHEKNVKELVGKLEGSGYTAFTKPIKTKKGTLTKVFVGPELIKSKLEEKLPHLKSLTGMQGKIAHFSPSK